MLGKAIKMSRTVLEGLTYARTLSPREKAKWIVGRVQDMGPTYVKLGQFMSSRADIASPDVIVALKTLQDSSNPLPWSDVRDIASTSMSSSTLLDSTSDQKLTKKLAWIDERPIASASIGQVHRGRLDDGSEVVVKVRRPGIVVEIADDIRLIESLISAASAAISAEKAADCRRIVGDLRRMIVAETDFGREVDNMELMTSMYPEIVIPRPYRHLCTPDIIVMSYVPSVKMTSVKFASADERSAMAYALMDSFVEQFLQRGLIHGDPHEGNVALSSREESMTNPASFVMYDLGHVVSLDSTTRSQMKVLVFELMTENVDGVIDAIERMPEVISIRDRAGVREFIGRYIEYVKTIDVKVLSSLDSKDENLPIEFSPKVFEIVRIFGIVEGICVTLDPTFEYSKVFFKYVDTLVLDRDFLEYKAGKDLATVLGWFIGVNSPR